MKYIRELAEQRKRGLSIFLSIVLAVMVIVPYLPPLKAKADTTPGTKVVLKTAHGDIGSDHKLYCIDKGGLAHWGIADDGDEYQYILPSESGLSKREQEYVFWGMLSLQASKGVKKANDVINGIKANSVSLGLPAIGRPVTEEDLKALIYLPSVRAKYPWLETVAANSEAYMKAGGLIGGSGATQSGKKVPAVIASHTSLTTAYQISKSDFTIHFDAGGADADFIQTVPIQFSNNDGGNFSPTPMDGWTYTKTSNSITFTNPNPLPPKVLIRFETAGTEYASTGGSYASEEEVLEQSLQVWTCIQCSGKHRGGTPPSSPLNEHQRLVWIEFNVTPVVYYAAIGGDPTAAPTPGASSFEVFRHEDEFTAHYQIQLDKYDHETGKPLEGARFNLFERFDDQDEIESEDGPAHIYEGGEPYASYHTDNPVTWNGFRKVGSLVTDRNGHTGQTMEHGYHYDKTFCNGHPAPVFVPVPEEEEDEETGDVTNSGEIEQAKATNQLLAQEWIQCLETCEDQASGDFEGVHFHWLMPDVDQGSIEDTASSGGDEGDTPDGGNTAGADGESSFAQSGCQQDLEETYEKFISLKYSYTVKEFKARNGYIRHDIHADDLPMEVITTDSSEHGANANFAGEYSNTNAMRMSLATRKEPLEQARSYSLFSAPEIEKQETVVPKTPKKLFQKVQAATQEIITFVGAKKELETEDTEETTSSIEDGTEEVLFDVSKTKPEKESKPSKEMEQESLHEESEKESKPSHEEKKQNSGEKGKVSSKEEQNETTTVDKPSVSETVAGPEEKKEEPKPEPAEESKETKEETEIQKVKETDKEPEIELSERESILVQAKNSTPSDAEKTGERKEIRSRENDTEQPATASEASFQWSRAALSFRSPSVRSRGSAASDLFTGAYESGLNSGSVGREVDKGSEGTTSHTWKVYDHRTEGELHLNKKDMDLASGETGNYDAYGDTQGDATLEGAVYGLFAASDLSHPDGKTGVVYQANNLVAVVTTDKNGNASFLANTEAPGFTYDYQQGKIIETANGWVSKAPKNLYVSDNTYDDYTEDSGYERKYQNNEAKNGNCWIGRPLLLGDYYVKELSRSEGYELSIGNRKHDLTNLGQDTEAKAPEGGTGFAVITQNLFADEQVDANSEGAKPNELFFAAKSKDTGAKGYDIVLSNLPKGAESYQKETGTKTIQVEVGTGQYEKVLLTNPDGTPKYIKAEQDYQYPKYNADGTLMTKEVPINYVANYVRQVAVKHLNETFIESVLNQADGVMTEAENEDMLQRDFTEQELIFVKGKLESALRKNGKNTPKVKRSSGSYDYSSIYAGIYDAGVREGERDAYGVSGVTPGSPASYTVYGSPVQEVAINKKKSDGSSLTVGDAILSLLNYYDNHPFYNYGGIESVEEKGSKFIFTVYASVSGNPENFMVTGSDEETDSVIYHSVRFLPKDKKESPRFVYVMYSNNPSYHAFGTYTDYESGSVGAAVMAKATLVTDAEITEDGNIQSKGTKENVYYRPGETVYDKDGMKMRAFTYRELTKTENLEVEDVTWKKLPVSYAQDETKYVFHAEGSYTDSYGQSYNDAGAEVTTEFKVVLKEKEVILSVEDVKILGSSFQAGKPMNSATYYTLVQFAAAKAYLDYQNSALVGDNTFIKRVTLSYPSDTDLFQDGDGIPGEGTRKKPVPVEERIIKQKVKIVKDIWTNPDGTYANNTNAESGHQDGFINGPGGTKDAATKLPNFRFKIYLKSNLERLYRNEAGEITWFDRNGTEVKLSDYQTVFPKKEAYETVQKLYTKVPHRTDSKTKGSIHNNVSKDAVLANDSLYSYESDGTLKEKQNAGYTRLLETVTGTMEDGAGKTRNVEGYNYEKFYDAIWVANTHKWDQNHAKSTSFKPFAYIREHVFGINGGEKENPVDHNNPSIETNSNTSDLAKEHALRSDAVRQFAITWYLKDEAAKLTEDNGQGEQQPTGGKETYQDEIYDKALSEAIKKAENYLKPFFIYDLDEIYAINWDSEKNGGADQDHSTLAANQEQEAYCYGVSAYLPYGVYVAVEQQPSRADLGDLYNKHYQIDKPKEIQVPSLYEAGGNEKSPEMYHPFYHYTASDTPEELEKKYQIRFNEEWNATHTDDLRNYVIRAQGNAGDYEIYKYGLNADRLSGEITYPGGSYLYQGFLIAQGGFRPYKDVYEAGNPLCDYKSNQEIKNIYSYAALSEQAEVKDSVLYQNPSGFYLKDGVKAMTGELTAYDGQYAAALVPFSVTEPAEEKTYDAAHFTGYADGKYRNRFYTSKLRIEKLDSETGETVLHDSAIFTLYSAKREDQKESDGAVQFYEKDTVISGSKEFLEAMGAKEITPGSHQKVPWPAFYQGAYSGTVPAGTPICKEEEQVLLLDEKGRKTGAFQAVTTTRDGTLSGEGEGDQNTGYLLTPQPLGAGCYVLAEIKAPAGYVRSKPVAIELYSDEVSYYLNGNKDEKVAAAIYEEQEKEKLSIKTQDQGDIARIYVNNIPIRLEIAKEKPEEELVSYELSGRVEGSLVELKASYGLENLELAYNASGTYLGYGWKKGFLEGLKKKQEAGEAIELLYEAGIFTGKAKLYKRLLCAEDTNRYLPGAYMTLYDAIEVKPSGDTEDYRYDGVTVERDRTNNVTRLYVKKGYAGNKVKFVKENPEAEKDKNGYLEYGYENQEDDKGVGTWVAKTVEREDTDLLFYDLGGLSVLKKKDGIYYGYDQNGKQKQLKNGESCYVLKNGTAMLEIVCADYESLTYSSRDKVFLQVPDGTKIYHLDSDKNRDSLIDPYTGMAYVVEEPTGKILTWPVNVSKDAYGNRIATEKITTSRIASINADTKQEYTIGTYEREGILERFRKQNSPVLNKYGLPEYYQKSDETYQKGSPVYDRDGDYVRYQYDDKLKAFNDNAYWIQENGPLSDIGTNPETATDDRSLYHRQGESFVIENTWLTGEKTPNDPLKNEMTLGQADVLKRVPAGFYIMEERKAPSGYVKSMPLGLIVLEHTSVQKKQVVDRPIGAYFEKLDAPNSYKVRIRCKEQNDHESKEIIEGKGSYTYQNIEGAVLSLYQAIRVPTSDYEAYPSGYYLKKKTTTPAEWTILDQDNQKRICRAIWRTSEKPKYFEEIPKGDYIWEELEAPSGYLRSSTEIEIKEKDGLQHFVLNDDHTKVEIYKYQDENGKKEPLRNENAAELTLYEMLEEGDGTKEDILYDLNKKVDVWRTDDCRDYTAVTDTLKYKPMGLSKIIKNVSDWNKEAYKSGFTYNFEKLYGQYGTKFESFSWETEEEARRDSKENSVFVTSKGFRIIVEENTVTFPEKMEETERNSFISSYSKNKDALKITWLTEHNAICIDSQSTDKEEAVFQIWGTDSGKQVAVCISRNSARGKDKEYVYEYQFNYKKLNSSTYPNAISYDTASGSHRIDYLPFNRTDKRGGKQGKYVIVETKIPQGYKAIKPKEIIVEETEDIQVYTLKNEYNRLEILKVEEQGYAVSGAKMALYKVGEDGELKMEPAYLVESWVSGKDGNYTKSDKEKNLIPEGLKEGDKRPHLITRIANGMYYVVELENPDGLEWMQPYKLEVTEKSDCFIKVVDRVKKGVIEIEKTDQEEQNKKLSGAKFRVVNQDTKENFYLITDENGHAESIPIKTGSVNENGEWIPYQFVINEIRPPKCYKMDHSSRMFHFKGKSQEQTLRYQCHISNAPTSLLISKSDFDRNQLIKGARLAIYHTKIEDGKYKKEGNAIEQWISNGKPYMVTGKLAASGTYLLEEQEAPKGYTCSKPVIFTISEDGRSITKVSDQFHTIEFQESNRWLNAVGSVTVTGRQAIGAETILSDLENGTCLKFSGDQEKILTEKDGIADGHLYEKKEITYYTDGKSRMSRRTIFRMLLDDQGIYRCPIREPQKTVLLMESEDRKTIDEWEVKNLKGHGYVHIIINSEYEEQDKISVISENGRYGAGIMPGSIIKYKINYKNDSEKKRNMKIKAHLDPKLEYMPANSSIGGRKFLNNITWEKKDVEPGESGAIIITASVKEGIEGKVLVKVSTEGSKIQCINPIVAEGGIAVVNCVSGTDWRSLLSETSCYQIFLSDPNNRPLKGKYPCTYLKQDSMEKGMIENGGYFELKGNETVVIKGLPFETTYKVLQKNLQTKEGNTNKKIERSCIGIEGETGKKGVSAVF